MNKTIIYLTDNSLREDIMLICKNELIFAAQDIPIISVSQKPVDLGKNICVGEIGRSWISLYSQILAGLNEVKTDYVCIAEHDCLYTFEHLQWTPPSNDIFFYNENCWFVQYETGEYSFIEKRRAQSQLICHKNLLQSAITEILELLQNGLVVKKGMRYYGEPGQPFDTHKKFLEAQPGRPDHLQQALILYFRKYTSELFTTEYPNLDIRYGGNFTGGKTGKNKCNSLQYWGIFKEYV